MKSKLFLRLNKEIWALALPNIISNISVPLLSTVDTALMGRLSAAHLGAVGLSSMIFNFLYWNFGFLRMGTTGLTAQSYGAKDFEQIMYTLWRALLLGLAIALVLFVFQNPLSDLAVLALQVQPGQIEMVKSYFFIRIWAAPAYMALLTITGWFFGMQNAIYPLILTAAVNVINIGLSFYLVNYQGMEIRGVALGTVAAQYFGCALGAVLFFIKYRGITFRIRWSRLFHMDTFHRFLLMNRDLFIRTVLLTLVFGFFYSQSSTFGVLSLAVSVVLMQFINWMSYGVDGMAFAAESVVGKYAGAHDELASRKAIQLIFAWGLLFAVLYAAMYGVFYQGLFRVFTNEMDVIMAGMDYRLWMILIPLLGFASYIWDGIFIGLTASRSMRNAMILPCIVFVVGYYLFQDTLGLHSLFLALTVFLFARGAVQTWMYWRKGLEMK
ncbi:MATE family efflux transporter [Membranicola marinus]|uniref:MATE family efflux transporter n=1 Tax=Membranihabitans marinus TaxID=1227546 RepID=A0A953I1V1_9BACT|nr:MATE family efflux transporter [Membranihabitans marinus]MBY5959747.1 MATE family efflux transporter [Membranihabitans marinus]